jgi:hypothetical protein
MAKLKVFFSVLVFLAVVAGSTTASAFFEGISDQIVENTEVKGVDNSQKKEVISSEVRKLAALISADDDAKKEGYQTYRVNGVNTISKGKEVIKKRFIGTLDGITRYFIGEIKFSDLEKIAELNGMDFDGQKYLKNDKSLWLYEGQEVRIPDSFLENRKPAKSGSSNVLAEAEKSDKLPKGVVQNKELKISDDNRNKKASADSLAEEKKTVIAKKPSASRNFSFDADANIEKEQSVERVGVETQERSDEAAYKMKERILKGLVGRLEGQKKNLEKDVEELAEQEKLLEGRVERLKAEAKNLGNEVKNIVKKKGEFEVQVAKLEPRVKNLEVENDTLKKQVAALAKKLDVQEIKYERASNVLKNKDLSRIRKSEKKGIAIAMAADLPGAEKKKKEYSGGGIESSILPPETPEWFIAFLIIGCIIVFCYWYFSNKRKRIKAQASHPPDDGFGDC